MFTPVTIVSQEIMNGKGGFISGLAMRWNVLEQFTLRAIKSQYKDSYFGVLLSFIDPLVVLSIFTIVFGVIFQSKLKMSGQESTTTFILGLYVGIVLYQFMAECLARSPTVLVSQPNFVKKVIFPLDVLPLSVVCAQFLQMLMNLTIIFMVMLGLQGSIPWTVVFLPVVLIPFFLFIAGMGWLLSAVGVYFRDIVILITPLRMFFLYSSAIFYSISIVPDFLKPLVLYNPLGFTVFEVRKVLVWGMVPDWGMVAAGVFIGALVFMAGYILFQRVKNGFSESL